MSYIKLQWKQGTPYSTEFDDIYHSSRGSDRQSHYVFLQGNNLTERFAAMGPGPASITIAETGFGTALNFIVTVQAFLAGAADDCYLDYISVDKDLVHPADLRTLAADHPDLSPFYQQLLDHYPQAVDGIQRLHLFAGRVRLTLLVGDATAMLSTLDAKSAVDAWYLDGFAPSINPQMWSQPLFDEIARLSAAHATLATYTIAGDVRRGLQRSGFEVSRRDGYASKRDMLVAQRQPQAETQDPSPWFAQAVIEKPRSEVAIVGAGIAGLMTAAALAKRGFSVVLIDQHPQVACAASGNPAALVMPRYSVNDDDDNSLQLQALLFAMRQYELIQQSVSEPLWHSSGVECALQRERVEALLQDRQFAQIARASERADTADGRRWFRYELSGWLRPDRLCPAIFSEYASSITLLNAAVAGIAADADTYRLHAADDATIVTADIVVMANAAGLCSIDGIPDFPLTSNLGQVTTVTTSGEVPAIPLAAGAYTTPVYEGKLTTGASYRHDLSQRSVLAEDDRFNLANLLRLQPGIVFDAAAVEGRVSARANCADRVPMVGAMPDMDYYRTAYADLHHGRRAESYPLARHIAGLYVNVAHGSRGFTTAPLCGEIIASMIDGSPAPVSRRLLDRLNPARFAVRRLKKSPADTI